VARQYAVSTCLYRQHRLAREHLQEIHTHGFTAVSLLASRPHVDYHNPAAVADLQQWLTEAAVDLSSVHAPAMEMSLASADAAERAAALAGAEHALHIARRIPFGQLIVHLGRPRGDGARGGTNRDAARRSIEALAAAAAPLGVSIAVEIIPNDLSRAVSLAELLDEDVEATNAGICLDIGHARLDGDAADAIEIVSGHLIAVELHDNRGRSDDHLVPFDGVIDWPLALTTVQKVGYDGALTFEIASRGPARLTLARAREARRRIDALMAQG